MLIAHEAAFQQSYLSGVVRAAGAIVRGPVADAGTGLELLNSGVDAMVRSYTLSRQDAVALIDAALSRGIRTVVVHPAQADVAHPFSDHRCLATPYAGFQIVGALADVLAATRGCVHWSRGGQ